jgi:lipopolysaccharide transport system ATP-binding protein
MPDAAIKVRGLGKRYRLGRLESGFERIRRLARGDHGAGEIWALRDVSFDVAEGGTMAIVGRNGAGKSTLLKLLARITEPTTGYAEVAGRVGALLEAGTGFNPELTGRENVYLNGTILGMSRSEIDRRLDEIVAFAGVEQHLDKPVKWYSSGMAVRLGFSVAAHLEPEVLIVDEVLSVGDLAFQQKCIGRMSEVAGGGRTVLFVSHNLGAVAALCSQAIYLSDGEIEAQGPTREVIDRYVGDVQSTARVDVRDRTDREGDGRLRFTEVCIGGGPSLMSGDDCEISLRYEAAPGPGIVRVSLDVYGSLAEPLFHCDNHMTGDFIEGLAAEGEFTCTIPRLPLSPGHYTISVFSEVDGKIADWVHHAAVLEVLEGDFFRRGRVPREVHGALYVDHRWNTESAAVTPIRFGRSAY